MAKQKTARRRSIKMELSHGCLPAQYWLIMLGRSDFPASHIRATCTRRSFAALMWARVA
jgi:hypothetical protein